MPPSLMRQIPLAVMLLSCSAPAVYAQTPSAHSAPATVRYDVPVQALNASLIAIASRGGVRISIDADLARGVSAAPCRAISRRSKPCAAPCRARGWPC